MYRCTSNIEIGRKTVNIAHWRCPDIKLLDYYSKSISCRLLLCAAQVVTDNYFMTVTPLDLYSRCGLPNRRHKSSYLSRTTFNFFHPEILTIQYAQRAGLFGSLLYIWRWYSDVNCSSFALVGYVIVPDTRLWSFISSPRVTRPCLRESVIHFTGIVKHLLALSYCKSITTKFYRLIAHLLIFLKIKFMPILDGE